MKKEKQARERVAFNRRISQKGQHGSLKLHTISKKLPADTLAAFGRWLAAPSPRNTYCTGELGFLDEAFQGGSVT